VPWLTGPAPCVAPLQASVEQLRESILVWLQATASPPAGGDGTRSPPLDESGDAPDMARLQQLAQRGVGRVTEILGAAGRFASRQKHIG